MDWDLQKFLSEMHQENKESIRILNKDVQDGFDRMSDNAAMIASNLVDHEKADALIQANIKSRLDNIEDILKNAKWFLRVGIVAFVTFLFDIILYHLPK